MTIAPFVSNWYDVQNPVLAAAQTLLLQGNQRLCEAEDLQLPDWHIEHIEETERTCLVIATYIMTALFGICSDEKGDET